MAKTTKPVWSQNITIRRKELKISAEDFAASIKISYPTYRDIEAGISEGRYENRVAIARGLKCSVADLYRPYGGEEPQLDYSSAGELLIEIAKLGPIRQAIVLYLIFRDEKFLEHLPKNSAQGVLSLAKAL